MARKELLAGQLEAMSEAELEMKWADERPLWRLIVGNGYIHPLVHVSGYYQAQGDMQQVGELTAMLGQPLLGLDDGSTWRGEIRYNQACGYALLGKKEKALAELSEALTLAPNLKEWSQQDADLDSLRGEAAYQALYVD